MRKYLVISLCFVSVFTLAQKVDQVPADSIPPEVAKKIFKYNLARQYNDAIGSRMAIYDLLAENPSHVGLRDTLALLFLEQQMYASAALVSQDVAIAVPEDMFAAEVAAVSFERLGVNNKALNFYERLFVNDPDNIARLYKIGFLQLDMKLYEEAMTSANQLIGHKLASETTLLFNKSDGESQEISMKLAALRLKSLVEKGKGNNAEAIKYLEEILAENPDFEVVKTELAELKK